MQCACAWRGLQIKTITFRKLDWFAVDERHRRQQFCVIKIKLSFVINLCLICCMFFLFNSSSSLAKFAIFALTKLIRFSPHMAPTPEIIKMLRCDSQNWWNCWLYCSQCMARIKYLMEKTSCFSSVNLLQRFFLKLSSVLFGFWNSCTRLMNHKH